MHIRITVSAIENIVVDHAPVHDRGPHHVDAAITFAYACRQIDNRSRVIFGHAPDRGIRL